MKKYAQYSVRTVFFVFILMVFACNLNLQWPKEIEIIKESPEMRIDFDSENISVYDFFEGFLDDFENYGDVKMINCPNTNIYTKIIYVKLLDVYFDPAVSPYNDFNDGFTVPADVVLESDSITINAPDLGSSLGDFTLDRLNARVYYSSDSTDTSFLNALQIIVETDNEYSIGRTQPSGLDSLTSYPGISLPGNSANNFYLSLNADQTINYSIVLKKDSVIAPGALDGGVNILVEFAVWVPFVLTAETDTELALPLSDEFDDIISADDEILDYLIDLNLKVVLNTNTFSGASLYFKNGTFDDEFPITGNELRIFMRKDDIEFPFRPLFEIRFKEGARLFIPRKLEIEELRFKAKLRFNEDAPDMPGWWPWS